MSFLQDPRSLVAVDEAARAAVEFCFALPWPKEVIPEAHPSHAGWSPAPYRLVFRIVRQIRRECAMYMGGTYAGDAHRWVQAAIGNRKYAARPTTTHEMKQALLHTARHLEQNARNLFDFKAENLAENYYKMVRDCIIILHDGGSLWGRTLRDLIQEDQDGWEKKRDELVDDVFEALPLVYPPEEPGKIRMEWEGDLDGLKGKVILDSLIKRLGRIRQEVEAIRDLEDQESTS